MGKKMLKKHMPKLRRMTEELLEREVLLEEDILRCFGPRPAPSIAAAAPYDPASCSPNDRKSSGTRDGAVSVSTESLAPTSKQLVARTPQEAHRKAPSPARRCHRAFHGTRFPPSRHQVMYRRGGITVNMDSRNKW